MAATVARACTHRVGNGVALSYNILGAGQAGVPLVLVQGLSGVKEDWRDFAAALSKRRPVVVFDNRGMGASECPRGPFSMQDMADDTASLIRAVLDKHFRPHKRVHLCGISMGGMISASVVCTPSAASLVDRLVLGCTHYGGDDLEPADPGFISAFSVADFKSMGAFKYSCRLNGFNYTQSWLADNQEKFEAIVHKVLETKRPFRTVAAQVAAIMGYDVTEPIRAICQKTLVVHGTGDRVVPYANGLKLVEAIPDAGLLRLPDVGHVFWDMDGGRAATVVDEFLSTAADEVGTIQSRL